MEFFASDVVRFKHDDVEVSACNVRIGFHGRRARKDRVVTRRQVFFVQDVFRSTALATHGSRVAHIKEIKRLDVEESILKPDREMTRLDVKEVRLPVWANEESYLVLADELEPA